MYQMKEELVYLGVDIAKRIWPRQSAMRKVVFRTTRSVTGS